MTETQPAPDDFNARLATLSSFDAVGIARCLAEISQPLSGNPALVGDDAVSRRLAAALDSRSDRKAWTLPLLPSAAGALAREILTLAAVDADLRGALMLAAERHAQDESMSAVEILAFGVAIALVVLVATTQVDWTQGKPVRIVKKTLDGDVIQRILTLLWPDST